MRYLVLFLLLLSLALCQSLLPNIYIVNNYILKDDADGHIYTDGVLNLDYSDEIFD